MTTMNRRVFMGKTLAGLGLMMGYPLYGIIADDSIMLEYDRRKRYILNTGDRIPPDELRMLSGYLKAYTVPFGTLNTEGGWTAIYDILTFSGQSPNREADANIAMSNAVLGQVAISRMNGKNEYVVRMEYAPLRETEELVARIVCNDDDMLSIKSWELDWKCTSPSGNLMYANHEKGEVAGRRLLLNTGSHQESFPCSQPLACLWTNIDAVRNLPARRFTKKKFNMYMDLSSLQNNHLLDYSGEKRCPVGNADIDLRFYRHLGEGINPIHYAVDQQQRTLFVTHGQLGWGLHKIVEG